MCRGGVLRAIHEVATISSAPSAKPSRGATRMNAATRMIPEPISASTPAFATVAPIRPPISACDELDGMPNDQVTRFQAIAPTSAPKIT
jgi:hypothetical protein